MKLRDYQNTHLNLARKSISNGNRRIILQGATGSGKTIEAAAITKGAIDKGNNVLFLVNKRDLVYQCRDRFESFGLGGMVSLIMSGEETDFDKPIKIGTVQTYNRRLKLADPQWNIWHQKAQVVIIDEAHSSVCRTYTEVINAHKQDAVIIGLTATPCRSDGRGLGSVFDEIICCENINSLTEKGYLVPMVYYVPEKPDLSKLRTVAGDYDKKQLGKKMDKPKLIGNVFEQWSKIAPERQTIIFSVNVKHSINIMREFEKHDVSVAHIDAHTEQSERERIYEGFLSKRIQVLTNVGIATEGSDLPIASCVVIARPTKSLGLYIQMAGRGLRPSPGKSDCIMIDHSGCWDMHGSVDDEIEWTLDDKVKSWKKKTNKKREKKYLVCDMCSHAFTGRVCPKCGHEVENYGMKVAAIDADLVEVGKNKKEKFTMDEKRLFWQMAEFQRRMKGYKEKWVDHAYRERFGCWPRGMNNLSPVEPDAGFKNWMTYRAIKYRKQKEKINSNHGQVDCISCNA